MLDVRIRRLRASARLPEYQSDGAAGFDLAASEPLVVTPGEDEVKVYNFTRAPVEVKAGDRIAQGLLIPVVRASWREADALLDASRGGFGATEGTT